MTQVDRCQLAALDQERVRVQVRGLGREMRGTLCVFETWMVAGLGSGTGAWLPRRLGVLVYIGKNGLVGQSKSENESKWTKDAAMLQFGVSVWACIGAYAIMVQGLQFLVLEERT